MLYNSVKNKHTTNKPGSWDEKATNYLRIYYLGSYGNAYNIGSNLKIYFLNAISISNNIAITVVQASSSFKHIDTHMTLMHITPTNITEMHYPFMYIQLTLLVN